MQKLEGIFGLFIALIPLIVGAIIIFVIVLSIIIPSEQDKFVKECRDTFKGSAYKTSVLKKCKRMYRDKLNQQAEMEFDNIKAHCYSMGYESGTSKFRDCIDKHF